MSTLDAVILPLMGTGVIAIAAGSWRVGTALATVAQLVRDHDRRISVLEENSTGRANHPTRYTDWPPPDQTR